MSSLGRQGRGGTKPLLACACAHFVSEYAFFFCSSQLCAAPTACSVRRPGAAPVMRRWLCLLPVLWRDPLDSARPWPLTPGTPT